MPASLDRWIARLPRWQCLCVGAMPGLVLALLAWGALALTGDPGKAILGTLGEGFAGWVLLPALMALSGILVNVASDRYLPWAKQAKATRDVFRNHDLAELVGRSIGTMLRAVAPKLGQQDAALARRLAARAESHWTEIAVTEPARTHLESIDERRLVGFVARPERTALTRAQTLALLAALNSGRPGTPPEFADAAESRVRRALAERFSESVRQALKQDTALDGRAAYAMQLDIAKEVLTAAAANLEHNEEKAAALVAMRATLDDLDRTVRAEGERTREVVRETAASTDARLAAIEAQLREVLTPKQAGEDPAQRQFSPELIAKARELAERGNQEQQAVAAIALRQHAQADRLIQALKREPLAEAARLLTLVGDNWYNADDFDRAIGPYEQALALRPDDPRAMNSAAIAQGQARLGDIAAHRRQAIALMTQAQSAWTREVHPAEWAATQNNLGNAWAQMPTGDRAEDLRRAIAAYGLALEVYAREAHPADWAMARFNLSLASRARSILGGGQPDLARAITSVRAAATVFTDANFPFYYRNHITPQLEALRTAWLEGGHGTQAEFDAIPPAE